MTSVQITKLNPRHNKIIDYCVEGMTVKQIAEKLNMSQRQVSIIINSGAFQHQLATRRSAYEEDHDEKLAESEVQTAHDILQQHAAEAAQKLVAGLKFGTDALQLRSAESILDRTGTTKITRQETDDKPIINISREDLQLLKETLELERELIPTRVEDKEIISTQTAKISEGGD